jgi:2-succinyl-5-enolpyruvyl-6-hydroxy-3-cyclohexene-1-carboxylate synthase
LNLSNLLIEQLVALGIEHFCLAPGSRSSPVALAIARLAPHSVIHFDERGLAFYALGLAKATRKPVALLTTSGTAVGNLLPAVMEAHHDHVPLILITADRPAELRDCSANQTTDQIKLFANCVRYQVDLPLSDPAFSMRYLASIVSHALFCAQLPRPGPVHLNCMLREPFIPGTPKEQPRFFEAGQLVAAPATVQAWAARLSEIKRGWILLGALPHGIDPAPYLALAETLGWPIYPDVLSQCRTRQEAVLITHIDLLAKAGCAQPPEAVVHFGGRTLSKALHQILQKAPPPLYLHVSDYPTLLDPDFIITHRLYACGRAFAEQLCAALEMRADREWLTLWQEANTDITTYLEVARLTEPGVVRHAAYLAAGKAAFFLANSMPVRDADAFLPRLEAPLPVFGNRGASGIDGNIATAAGIAHGLGKPVIAFLGDLAFLHDMNSLALLKSVPLCLIVINNQGGGIFSFLDISKESEGIFEKFIATSHALHFASAAALFDIPYFRDDLTPLDSFFQKPRAMLIEVCTDRKENARLHAEITQRLKEALHVTC